MLSEMDRQMGLTEAVKGNWQLDNSIQSKIVAVVFSMTAEIERDLIAQMPECYEGSSNRFT